uniref:BPTI/Kunitz inhibitor domain-containing protein n=1 Tax=Castor canadensis TaxID=51338 RepID=A0A8C0XBQ0_CASCN
MQLWAAFSFLLILISCQFGFLQPLSLFTAVPYPCYLPKNVGLCRAGFPNWYYNIKTRRCERFLYGGCKGNDNNFSDEQTCKVTC